MLAFETPHAQLGYRQADQRFRSKSLDCLAFALVIFLSVEWLARQYFVAKLEDGDDSLEVRPRRAIQRECQLIISVIRIPSSPSELYRTVYGQEVRMRSLSSQYIHWTAEGTYRRQHQG